MLFKINKENENRISRKMYSTVLYKKIYAKNVDSEKSVQGSVSVMISAHPPTHQQYITSQRSDN